MVQQKPRFQGGLCSTKKIGFSLSNGPRDLGSPKFESEDSLRFTFFILEIWSNETEKEGSEPKQTRIEPTNMVHQINAGLFPCDTQLF